MTHGASINIPEYWERPEHVGQLWVLRKGRRKATCELWTFYPIGGEIRAEVSGELALVDLATQWREQFIGKGWAG